MTAQPLHVLWLLCAFLLQVDGIGSASNLTIRSQAKANQGGYTQNSLCRQNNCVNPIFPGLNDLPRLEALKWQCSSNALVKPHMNFCQDAVIYDPALPSPLKHAQSVAELVQAQDDAAMTMFVYHLSGMGFDAWDHQEPGQSDNDCVKSVWKMVCHTYFPRANAGCKDGELSLYQRPCQSSCKNYLAQCGVECCDESVQCVFTRTETNKLGKVEILQSGYVDVDGPSAMCTGGARRSVTSPFFLIFALFGFHWVASASGDIAPSSTSGPRSRIPFLVIMAVLALSLQGCTSTVDRHSAGNWRSTQNYLNEYRFVPPGVSARGAILNSCSAPGIAASLQCSGRGYCKAFSAKGMGAQQPKKALAFCNCDVGYADPECGTERKSQMKAFALSLCLGMFGADYFYLGFPLVGICKLLTLGGFGFWWLVDIIRIASGPVYAYKYRTANDLSHWIAMLTLIFLCLVLGFLAAIESFFGYRKAKRDDMASLEHSEENSHKDNFTQKLEYRYGATPPLPNRNAGVPFAEMGPFAEMR